MTQKEQVEQVLQETKECRDIIDAIDEELKNCDKTPLAEDILRWARKAGGAGNFIRKRHTKFMAITKNKKGESYIKLKLEAGASFKVTQGKEEAAAEVNDYRLLRDILLGYVQSADNILSICRMHKLDSEKEGQYSANL